MTTVIQRLDEINEKWFAYGLDLATMIQYPLLFDMREPLRPLAFHHAEVRADDERPTPAETVDPETFTEYRARWVSMLRHLMPSSMRHDAAHNCLLD